jgi:hypothetical protein
MADVDETNKALAIALVRAHIITDDEYMSYVPPYTKVRWSRAYERCVAERVGGHFRRKALYKKTLSALACVCKQPVLASPAPSDPPIGRSTARARA